jgi:iron complex transport system substrate-binding protein
VADPEDGASRLFYGLGMEIDPEILALDEGAVGRVQLSLEQAGLLDADLLGILTNGDDPAALPGWDQLPSVRQGSVVDFELADVVGLNTPTPLSIPHVIELLRPALEVVAAAG